MSCWQVHDQQAGQHVMESSKECSIAWQDVISASVCRANVCISVEQNNLQIAAILQAGIDGGRFGLSLVQAV